MSSERLVPTGWDREEWRWYVVSVARAAASEFETAGIIATPELIIDLVRKKRRDPIGWSRFIREAIKIRSREQEDLTITELLDKYGKIDEDDSLNCSFLDETLLPNRISDIDLG